MTAETAVALRPSGQLQITDDQDYWTPEQYAGLKALGIKGATEGDLAIYFHYCRRTMLDPFSRQIYMINRKQAERYQDDRGNWQERWVSKQTIQVGIDGFRVVRDRVAERTNCEVELEDTVWYDADEKEYKVWVKAEPPVACRVVLVKHSNATGRALRYPAVLRTASYMQVNKQGHPVSQWKTQPEHMIEKCCEAFATRRAFPNDFSGVYIEEEMQGRADDGLPEATRSRRVTPGQILRATPPEADGPDAAGDDATVPAVTPAEFTALLASVPLGPPEHVADFLSWKAGRDLTGSELTDSERAAVAAYLREALGVAEGEPEEAAAAIWTEFGIDQRANPEPGAGTPS
jgi:phage recombination protein Bet